MTELPDELVAEFFYQTPADKIGDFRLISRQFQRVADDPMVIF